MQKPPAHLGKTGTRLWTQVLGTYTFSDTELPILDILCTSSDRIAEARDLIASEGICVTDRFGGSKQHPATLIEKDASARLIAAYKALGLDRQEEESSVQKFLGRPPGK